MKFGLEQKFELKMSFEFYRQTLERAINKVAKNFIHFEGVDKK
jgi:hypothetical protein